MEDDESSVRSQENELDIMEDEDEDNDDSSMSSEEDGLENRQNMVEDEDDEDDEEHFTNVFMDEQENVDDVANCIENICMYWNVSVDDAVKWRDIFRRTVRPLRDEDEENGVVLDDYAIMVALADRKSLNELCIMIRSKSEGEKLYLFGGSPGMRRTTQRDPDDPDIDSKYSQIIRSISEMKSLRYFVLCVSSLREVEGAILQIMQRLPDELVDKVKHLETNTSEWDEETNGVEFARFFHRLKGLESIQAGTPESIIWRQVIAPVLSNNRRTLRNVMVDGNRETQRRPPDISEEVHEALGRLELLTTLEITGFSCIRTVAHVVSRTKLSKLSVTNMADLDEQKAAALRSAIQESSTLQTFELNSQYGFPLKAHETVLLLRAVMESKSIKNLSVLSSTASGELYKVLKDSKNDSSLVNLTVGFVQFDDLDASADVFVFAHDRVRLQDRFSDFVRLVEEDCLPCTVKKIEFKRNPHSFRRVYDEQDNVRLAKAMKSNFSLHEILVHVGLDGDGWQRQYDAGRLASAYLALNRAGRNYTDKANSRKGAEVLFKVANNLDALYLHLLETPSIVSSFRREREPNENSERSASSRKRFAEAVASEAKFARTDTEARDTSSVDGDQGLSDSSSFQGRGVGHEAVSRGAGQEVASRAGGYPSDIGPLCSLLTSSNPKTIIFALESLIDNLVSGRVADGENHIANLFSRKAGFAKIQRLLDRVESFEENSDRINQLCNKVLMQAKIGLLRFVTCPSRI